MDTLCHNCVVQVEKDVFRLIKLAETKAHSGDVESADGIKVSALAAAAYSSALFLVGVRRVCLFEVKLVQAGHGASNSQLVANSKAGCWRSIKAKRCVIFLNPPQKKLLQTIQNSIFGTIAGIAPPFPRGDEMQANEATQSSCVPPRPRDLNAHHVRVCSPLLRDPFPLKPPGIYIGVGTLSHEFDKAQNMTALKKNDGVLFYYSLNDTEQVSGNTDYSDALSGVREAEIGVVVVVVVGLASYLWKPG